MILANKVYKPLAKGITKSQREKNPFAGYVQGIKN